MNVLYSPWCIYNPQGRFWEQCTQHAWDCCINTSSSVTTLSLHRCRRKLKCCMACHMTSRPLPRMQPPPTELDLKASWEHWESNSLPQCSPAVLLQQVVPFLQNSDSVLKSLSLEFNDWNRDNSTTADVTFKDGWDKLKKKTLRTEEEFIQTCHLFFKRRLPMPWDTELALIPPRS